MTDRVADGDQRIAYGEETDDRPFYYAPDADVPCRDCGTAVGELHTLGCDVEQCPDCGQQLIGCDCTI